MSEPLVLIGMDGNFWEVRPENDPRRYLCEEESCTDHALWNLRMEDEGYRLLCQRHALFFFDLLPGDLVR